MTSRARRLVGPCTTLALIGVICSLRGSALEIPDSPAILMVGVIFSSFMGGVESGLISVVPALGFIVCSFSGEWRELTGEGLRRIGVWGTTMPVAAVMIGLLRRRLGRAIGGGGRENDGQFHLLADGVKDYAIVMLDPEGRVASWNAGAERILGYSEREVLGLSLYRFYSEDDSVRFMAEERFHRAAVEGRVEEEGWRVRKDGVRFQANTILTAIRDESGRLRGYSEVIRDVTEYKRLEAQLAQAQKMEAIGRLSAGVAHDFNNALTVILGYAELLLGRYPGNTSESVLVREILAAGKRASSLTRQLLTFGRQHPVSIVKVDPNEVVARVDKLLRQVIPESVRMITVLQPGVGTVRADANQLEQVLVNLIINARDAMPRGGSLTMETADVDSDAAHSKVHVGMPAGPYVMISVSDTGCGMSPEVQAHLFEPFFTTKGPGKGNGLGLTMVHGIVKQHRGHIWVYSEEGKGTSFKIYLPRVSCGDEAVVQSNTAAGPVLGTETILLVDDSEVVCRLTGEILRKGGYMVLETSGGEEALKACREYRGSIHLLVTDYVMPRMGGLELARQAVELRPELAVLCISGYNDSVMSEDGRIGAGVRFLEKPFSGDILLRKVRAVLDERASR